LKPGGVERRGVYWTHAYEKTQMVRYALSSWRSPFCFFNSFICFVYAVDLLRVAPTASPVCPFAYLDQVKRNKKIWGKNIRAAEL
jgi:hypothetical protein